MGAFFVSFFCVFQAAAFCPAPAGLPQVTVKQVVDGDTLRLDDGRSVRLIGLNAPELGRHGRAAEPYAVAARMRLQELVAASDGRLGLQVGRESRDRYGRTLAHLYDHEGRNLEAQLLGEGLGFQVAIAPNLALVECQRQAERQARVAHLGLWRDEPGLAVESLDRAGFALLRGRVARVERNRGGIWLEFGGAVAMRVDSRQLGYFDQNQLMALAGRYVEARGWVVDRARGGAIESGRARWLLPLSHPAMLEVLP